MTQTTWLVQRAVLAVALLVGFYVFAISLALGLLWLPYAEWTYAGRVHLQILIGCLGGAVAILWALVPRADKFAPPGPLLQKSEYPDLFRNIEDIAAKTRQAMPSDVYLVNEVNAWVTHRGGVMGVGSRRVMGVGLPLLQLLTVSELRAVIAHEFGHYHSGDVAIGPWIYKTRAAIARTVSGLEGSWLQELFLWYGRQFLKLTHGVSRQQEFLADKIAAATCGAGAMSSALRRVAAAGPMFTNYLRHEVVPILNAGFLPPIATGFNTFLADDRVKHVSQQLLDAAEREAAPDPFDTHPPLRERLDALGPDATFDASGDRSAISLIADADKLAVALVEHALGDRPEVKLTPLEWRQVGDMVYAASWRDTVKHHAGWLRQFTADDLPNGEQAFLGAGEKLINPDEQDLSSNDRIARAMYLLGAGIGALLLENGWSAYAAPGKPVVLMSGENTFDPFGTVQAMAAGEVTIDGWKQQCQSLRISGQRLGGRAN